MQQSNEVFTTTQVLNKDMGFNMTMNRYVAKDGSECVMHNNKTHVTTANGKEWTLASTIVTVAGKSIPVSEPAKVVNPTPGTPTPAPVKK